MRTVFFKERLSVAISFTLKIALYFFLSYFFVKVKKYWVALLRFHNTDLACLEFTRFFISPVIYIP